MKDRNGKDQMEISVGESLNARTEQKSPIEVGTGKEYNERKDKRKENEEMSTVLK